MNVNETLNTVVETLEKSLNTKRVFGEALQVGNVTLIPVMDLTFGFGGGGGEGKTKENDGTGGGGGGGARLAPKAIVAITDGNVSVMPVTKGGSVEKILDAIPGLIDKIAAKKCEAKATEE